MSELDQMSDEALEAALVVAGQGEPEPELPTEPAPPPPPPAAEAAPPAESTPPPTAEATAPPADPEVSELDILRAENAELMARSKHWEEVSGRIGGRIGWLEQQLKVRPATPPADDDPGTELSEVPARAPVQPDDPYRSYVISLAISQAGQEFMQTAPDLQEMWPAMGKYISEHHNPARLIESNDPIFALSETKRVLSAAYSAADAERKASRKSELVQKRAEQIKSAEEAKKRASLSAPGGVPPPAPRSKTANEMSDAELDGALGDATRGARW
jgi:hypothetical protein